MSTSIFSNPGQTVRLVVQVLDSYGNRSDGYVPLVTSVYFPNLSLASGYPIAMTRIDTGLYIHGLTLPTGNSSLGTYIANVYSKEVGSGLIKWEVFQIQVARPFGNSSVVPL
jgi:hypothetical protein